MSLAQCFAKPIDRRSHEAQLLKAAYPLTWQGLARVLSCVNNGKNMPDLQWLEIHNPPGLKLANILCDLSAEELAAVWSKLEATVASREELRAAKAAHAKASAELLDALHPATAAARQAEEAKAADEWWEREGKYEEEIEERGEAKYFHYEQARAEEHGETLSARDYLAGKTAFDND